MIATKYEHAPKESLREARQEMERPRSAKPGLHQRHASQISVAVKGSLQAKKKRKLWFVKPISIYDLLFTRNFNSGTETRKEANEEPDYDKTDRTMTMDNDPAEIEDEDLPDPRKVFLCLDISAKYNVVISQWCLQEQSENGSDDSQLSGRRLLAVIDSPQVDEFTLPSDELGRALASLHNANNHLNLMLRKWSAARVHSSFKKHHLRELCDSKRNMDRTASLAESFGENVRNKIMKNLKANLKATTHFDHEDESSSQEGSSAFLRYSSASYHRPSSLANMSHSFINAPFKSLRSFNPLDPCDNDQSSDCASIGRDVGMPFTFAIAFALSNAINGNSEGVDRAMQSISEYRSSYAHFARKAGVDDKFIVNSFLNGIGWCGWFLYIAHYRSASYMSVLPLEGVSDEDKEIVLDAIGMVSLEFMHLAFGGDHESGISLESLFQRMDEILEQELDSTEDVADLMFLAQAEKRMGSPCLRQSME